MNKVYAVGDHILYHGVVFQSEGIVLAYDAQNVLLAIPGNLIGFQGFKVKSDHSPSDWHYRMFQNKPFSQYLPNPLMIWQFLPWVGPPELVEKILKSHEHEVVFE